MFESKLNRGRAGGYAPLDGSGKVPLDKLPPIQSTIDTGSFVTNNQTGSFATTDSNIFTGDQTISTIKGTGSLYLQPDSEDFRHFEIYNTSPSDTHIKANGGLSYFGDDTNYLRIDDASGDVTIAAFSDIILDADDGGVYIGSYSSDNGVITSGYLNTIIGDTDIINGATGNSITDVIGRISTIDSSSFATTGSNTFIGNQTISGSLTFTGSSNIHITSPLTIVTPSSGVPNSVSNWQGQGGWNQGYYANVTTTGGTGTGLTVNVAAGGGGYINISAISINTPGSGYSNGDVITIDNENNLPGTFTIGVEQGSGWTFDTYGSLTTPGNINVNGSATIDGGYLILTGSSAPTNLTGSIGDTKGMVVFDDNYLYYCTSDFEPETYIIVVMPGTTYNTHVAIPKNQGIPVLSSNGWSITTQDNTTYVLTGVYSDNDNWDCEIDNLNSTYNGGIQMMTLTNLNYVPVDIWKRVSLNPSSVDVADFTFTTDTITNSDVTIVATDGDIILDADGGVYVGSNGSGNGIVTAGYFDGVIGDTNIVNNGTGNTITDNLTNIINSIPTLNNVISSSQQITDFGFVSSSTADTTQLNNFSGSVNTYTSSNDSVRNRILQTTASLNTYTGSNDSVIVRILQTTASLNTLTGSVSGIVNGLMAYTSSVIPRILQTTASLNSKTGSYATTASNQFNGNQQITGSLSVSTNLTVSSTLVNDGAMALTNGSNLTIGTGSLLIISSSQFVSGSINLTGSLNVTGSINIDNVIKLTPVATLPNGQAGMLVASSSYGRTNLYMYDGAAWKWLVTSSIA